MGCGHFRNNVEMRPVAVRRVEDLLIRPNTFVHRNLHWFGDIYNLNKLQGSGEFTEVYECTHKKSGKLRAVKIYKKAILHLNNNRDFFQREIEVLKYLDHPYIIKLYELFEDQSQYYIVMEYTRGTELFQEILEHRTFTEYEVAVIARSILLCFSYLHEMNIVIRDLKPESIIIDGVQIKLIGLGNSCKIIPGKRISDPQSVTYYVAPEVIHGSYNEKCDLWSLGVIVYTLFTGFPPFTGDTDEEIIENVKAGRYKMVEHLWNVSDEGKDFISQLLQKENKRPSAKEALNHPFIQKAKYNHSQTAEPVQAALNNLMTYPRKNKLAETILTYIASQLFYQSDISSLVEIFLILDADNDGKIDKDDLVEGLKKFLGKEVGGAEEAENIIRIVDTGNYGYISYTEFIKAAIDYNTLVSAENLNAAFDMFDQEGDKQITASELKIALQADERVADNVWTEMVASADIDGGGILDQNEFRLLFVSDK
ncbi:unnamed protein product [Blepharisma stoltei]|uniref:non-specific serine/threonine protein kinase n=1 Tax=Blepharisma stoltei TaxID=1481888 RepID=A0AAU9JSD9_9CILI|nr:unnamed protein product [Blepharisma stoltei]